MKAYKRMDSMIRVFPRKTKWTPDDDLAFIGGPPLFDLTNIPAYISVTFSWDIERGKILQKEWDMAGYATAIGGPAFGINMVANDDFVPGRFLKEGVTITSRGCNKKCPWCVVPEREGKLREINISDGYIIQDNNLLACSRDHIERVFEMLSRQKKAAEFKGGLDVDYLKNWHIELLKKIRVNEIWIACDTNSALNKLDKAADLLSDFSIEKKRCFVLGGFGGESILDAEKRCQIVYEKGFLPFAQPYKSPDCEFITTKDLYWCLWARKWSRPAIYRSKNYAKP